MSSVVVAVCGQAGYSIDLETELRTKLYTGYEVLQRPSQTVDVNVTLNIITINSMDIKEQMLSTAGYFALEWDDSRLAWDTDSTYTNVNFLFSTEAYTWRPTVIVENSITMSTWAYTSGEVKLVFYDEPIDVSSYKENGEWQIMSKSTSDEQGTRESQSFSRLHFTMELRRRPLFHILNTLFPVVLMASLTVFVFKLPPESGERISMSLTVLLAYAVYLTLIAENIPQISLSASILSLYLTIILIISCLSVIFTIVVLDIYFNRDEQEIPNWVQKLTCNFLVYFACWKGNRIWKRKKRVSPSQDYGDTKSLTDSKLVVIPFRNRFGNKNKEIMDEKIKESENETTELKRPKSGTSMESGQTEKLYKWREIALIVDRCFMYIFIFMVALSSIICMALLVDHYVNA